MTVDETIMNKKYFSLDDVKLLRDKIGALPNYLG